jgi:hypothetical protein
MPSLSPTLRVIGPAEHPYSGRVFVRRFPFGDYETLYVSMTDSPTEIERVNAWLEDAGEDNRAIYDPKPRPIDPETGEELERLPKESDEDRVIRRARQRIRWAAKMIGADRLLTLTFRDEITDYATADKIAGKFLAMCRRRWDDWLFVMCPEIQDKRMKETGVAVWHFHLAIRGYRDFHELRAFWWRACGAVVEMRDGVPVLMDRELTPGNIDVQRRKGCVKGKYDVGTLAGYLSAYVSKSAKGEYDLGGRPSYRVSRGLIPHVERYIVRALSYEDVLAAFYPLGLPKGAARTHLFESPDKRVLWASGCTQAR